MRNQDAVAKKEHVAALAWGMRKFYEAMDHSKLKDQATKSGLPTAIIDVAVNAYRMARNVTYEGVPSADLYPSGA